jgi:hypothetical protein
MKEEEASKQIAEALQLLALPPDWADWMIAELEADQVKDSQEAATAEAQTALELRQAEEKIDRLTAAYLEATITLPEYREMKNRLIADKQLLKEKLVAFGENRSKRFEPAIRFIKASKEAGILATDENISSRLNFFKKVGSNLTLVNRKVRFTPRDAWQTLAAYERLGQNGSAASLGDAAAIGETDHMNFKRRGGDSNSRYPCGQTGFRNRRVQPLRHLSRKRGV